MKEKKMFIKFENKSNRVKGLSFHPTRPWILASLHNGVVQLWDYRMEVMIESFEEHDGPVRGIDFHSTQPLFVSGGDDYKIKVWNYQLKRCLFSLLGHLDYIRTVQFHKEYPWILSASDDQTIRIWNWQSRQCLSVLTGHNHYVMCAQFHPREDLILSASLDQTVRIWDVSGLRKKTVSIAGEMPSNQQNDLFGTAEVVVKHVLEGHNRGVNWASFHPTLSLIVSGADDREVRLWRMNDVKAWYVDTMRGHINNVSCVVFHPKKELIISNSEDKSIRVWDISKQASPIVLRRDSDRYWILDAHPKLNLLAAGHDSGLVVFKLNRERPPYQTSGKNLYYYKDQYIYEYNFKTDKERPILSTRRQRGNGVAAPSSLQYNYSNKSEHCVLLCTDSDSSYELYTFPKGSEGSREDGANALRGYGRCAVFLSRNRFAVLDKSRQIWLKNLKNETKRKLTIPNTFITAIFPGGIGRILIRTSDSMILYDIQALKIVSEYPIQSRHPIKFAIWSEDNKYVAMLSRANILITNSKLEETCSITENTRIKSGAWDKCGVFVYTTSTHIKYLLPNGDSGIIRTLENPVYLTSVINDCLCFIDREGNTGKCVIDNTEYQFKIALIKKRHKEVLRIMQMKKLVGQSIISYLQEKGYPEVALHFVQDEKVKFDLALECGNIAVALECASKIDENSSWHKLGVEALRQGNHQVVEAAYQKTKNFERLSFLYLITGNMEKLGKMQHIARLREDLMSRLHNALFLGDVRERVAVLKDAGQLKLAYVCAKAHALSEEASALEEELGDNIPDLPDLTEAKNFAKPHPIYKEDNWPLLEVRRPFVDDDMEEEVEEDAEEERVELDDDDDDMDMGDGDDAGAGWGDLGLPDADGGAEEEGGGGGWGDDLDMLGGVELGGGDDDEAADDDDDVFVMPTDGKSAFMQWSNNSTIPADLVASGSFDMAMHVLNRTVGVVNFAPLKPMFINIYNASYATLPLLPGCSSLTSPMYRPDDDKALPASLYSVDNCVDILKKAYKSVTEGKLQAAKEHFSEILLMIPLLVAQTKAQVADVLELKSICQQYVTAMRIELARRKATDPVRQAQLAAYFTHCKMQPTHQILALRGAIKAAYTIKCYKTTAAFCRKLLELAVASNQAAVSKLVNAKQIKGILKLSEKENTEAHDLAFDETSSFNICCSSMTTVGKSAPSALCPYCGSFFKGEFEGTLCMTCDLAKIGAETTGLKIFLE